MSPGRALIETEAGLLSLGWTDAGIAALRLPGDTAEAADAWVARRLPDAPRAPAPAGIADPIRRYFAGERVSFDAVTVDLGRQQPFFGRVYAAVRALGWGETTTYGALARSLGAGPAAAQAVGQAMARNPVPLIVPCHRVLAADGRIGGFTAPGGADAKARMLALEGVRPEQAAFGFSP